VLPSVKLPVAVNCRVVPDAMEGVAGFTEIETSDTLLTVSVVEPEIEPDAAEMVELPAAPLTAIPWLPAVLLMLATELFDEVH
jgi:hypothetical protein